MRLFRDLLNMDYMDILDELVTYDVRACLWQPLRKFERNLPLRSFDYMSVGLPIVTSNFGNLAKYASESGSALCINPLDYKEFEVAITRLFDPLEQKKLGENGIRYTQNIALFRKEAEPFIKTIFSLP